MRKGEKALDALVRCSAELFDARGYERVSVSDICAALGWPKSLFYYYCPTKSQAVGLAAQLRAQQRAQRIAGIMDKPATPINKLNSLLRIAAFWRSGDAAESARELGSLYREDNLPWRVYSETALRAALADPCAELLRAAAAAGELLR